MPQDEILGSFDVTASVSWKMCAAHPPVGKRLDSPLPQSPRKEEEIHMPKNPVTDPITDQEIAFARLILSGTMNDPQAAEAVGLNPTTAAYTKSKPRVQAYMAEHRAAVNEKLVNQEAEGLRHLNLGRDQILARLWHLAHLSPEETRGSITGQIKAMSMIVAIEGLIPDRRAPHKQPAAPPVQAQMHVSEPLREAVPAADVQPAVPPVPQPKPSPTPGGAPLPHPDRNHTSLGNPFVYPEAMNRVPTSLDLIYDVNLNAAGPLKLLIPPEMGALASGR
jgi:hypothetical protein